MSREFQLILYQSIALEIFYKMSFETAGIGWSAWTQIHDNGGSRVQTSVLSARFRLISTQTFSLIELDLKDFW